MDLKEKRLLSMVSLARKAGKVVTGEEGCEKAVQKGQAHLLLVATDASAGTKKKFTNKTTFYKVPIHSFFTKEQMGEAIGTHSRAAIVVTDEGFSKKILEIIESMGD
ncbi:MAG: ribosomal L7Ae/L30e/S12e/Gadd45 family protein [Defluviitaleaceae bacterium]|nr:ribosomal L7Ae/L30e/S12e/Gadd45 family protein [Defluviitaleaceae bacterium]